MIGFCLIDLAGTVLAQDSFALSGLSLHACLDQIPTLVRHRCVERKLDQRARFDPAWQGVGVWVTPAYRRLINTIWAVYTTLRPSCSAARFLPNWLIW